MHDDADCEIFVHQYLALLLNLRFARLTIIKHQFLRVVVSAAGSIKWQFRRVHPHPTEAMCSRPVVLMPLGLLHGLRDMAAVPLSCEYA